MSRKLHLTNGTSIVGSIRAAGVEDPIVAWNDLLHEGPVPAGLGAAALRQVRADFLAGCGWGSTDRIARELEDRDLALDVALGAANRARTVERRDDDGAQLRFAPADEIVLWLEHDLYDQLQLIQILDRLPVDGGVRVSLVQPSTYLGHLPASEFGDLLRTRRAVTSAERLAAHDAWQAFRDPDPRALLSARARVAALPHLPAALQRHIEQFPSIDNGLSRTEQQTLEAVAGGARTLGNVYARANHDREEAVFMGDAGFLFHIASLIRGRRPLLTVSPRRFPGPAPEALELTVDLTDDGRRVLTGDLDRVTCCSIDRWLGGVHLQGHGPMWRWDAARLALRFV